MLAAAGLATGLPLARGDGLGEGLPIGLAVGAGLAIIAVGVAGGGDPMAVGELATTLLVGEEGSAPLQAATNTPRTANSMIRRIKSAPQGDSHDRTQARYAAAPNLAPESRACRQNLGQGEERLLEAGQGRADHSTPARSRTTFQASGIQSWQATAA